MGNLAARRRRFILTYLLNTESGQVTFDALVDYVVEEETHSPSSDRESVATTLHHSHLPKLADEGLVDVDWENGSITTTDRTRLTEPYLEFAQNWQAKFEAD